eukprot:TRINITY_DN32117_c0_g1_i1.p1 TRINITY_DN32117_c0_g1~~TRINITY_DN32117_c0_g1_i1.p1  ORF type:complete len:353 (-),score=88.23 TRINITY_DN32117_c0_g1_i1:233-1291(-)
MSLVRRGCSDSPAALRRQVKGEVSRPCARQRLAQAAAESAGFSQRTGDFRAQTPEQASPRWPPSQAPLLSRRPPGAARLPASTSGGGGGSTSSTAPPRAQTPVQQLVGAVLNASQRPPSRPSSRCSGTSGSAAATPRRGGLAMPFLPRAGGVPGHAGRAAAGAMSASQAAAANGCRQVAAMSQDTKRRSDDPRNWDSQTPTPPPLLPPRGAAAAAPTSSSITKGNRARNEALQAMSLMLKLSESATFLSNESEDGDEEGGPVAVTSQLMQALNESATYLDDHDKEPEADLAAGNPMSPPQLAACYVPKYRDGFMCLSEMMNQSASWLHAGEVSYEVDEDALPEPSRSHGGHG